MENELGCAKDAAAEASKILLHYFRGNLKFRDKGPGLGLVSNADEESEKAIISIIKQKFPNDSILGEESGAEGAGDRQWVIDPLDGTTNYIHGFPIYCTSIALCVRGQPVVGVIAAPSIGEEYWAITGRGSYSSSNRMKVSSRPLLKESLLVTGFSLEAKLNAEEIKVFSRVMDSCRAVRRPGSAALDLAWVAEGIFDAFWERELKAWDVAAGALLVREAGGLVTDYLGKDWVCGTDTLVASNSHVHTELKGFINS